MVTARASPTRSVLVPHYKKKKRNVGDGHYIFRTEDLFCTGNLSPVEQHDSRET